jgi:Mn2+/Fe2+ NRAMP family transporter
LERRILRIFTRGSQTKKWKRRWQPANTNIVMYFTILATAATLFVAAGEKLKTAMEAAQLLTPLAGAAAGLLFAVGIIGVGFLAIPVMTTGAAYDVSQSFGWKNGLYRKPAEARKFYVMIAIFTAIAVALNFGGH